MTPPPASDADASERPAGPARAGQVWAHVGQPFAPREFDVVVVGAGRMGSALAWYLRQLAPHLSLLLVEEGGLPNEEGATILAPGLWSALGLPAAVQAQAHWTREQLAALPGVQWQPRVLAHLLAASGAHHHSKGQSTADALDPFPEALALVDPEQLPVARLDAQAATYRPGSLALHAAQAAIGLGANLLLNTRAAPQPGGVRLERLSVTNTHAIVTHEVHEVRARVLVVAAGASGPMLAEQELGLHSAHGRAYVQFPHLACPSEAAGPGPDGTEPWPVTPAMQVGPLRLWPQNGGWTLCAWPDHRDPQGYVPAAGQLTGVPTGLRRELLETLVAHMDAVPALATGALHLGRSLSDVPGAWFCLPGGHPHGLPQWQALTDAVYLLLGGLHADTLGLSTAYDLAAHLAGIAARPWGVPDPATAPTGPAPAPL